MKKSRRFVYKLFFILGIGLLFSRSLYAETALHTVQVGDTLWNISQRYQMSLDSLLQLNGIEKTTTIYPGQQLKVKVSTPDTPQTYQIRPGDTLISIARQLNVDYLELQKYNHVPDASKIYIGMELTIPGAAAAPVPLSTARFIWPVEGTITSKYGQRDSGWHDGLDLSVPVGKNVVAAASGTVTKSGWGTGYGYMVIIKHADGYETLYAHNSKLMVKVGDAVKTGQVVALSGNTGRSTGPHLHFEVRIHGKTVDPLLYLP